MAGIAVFGKGDAFFSRSWPPYSFGLIPSVFIFRYRLPRSDPNSFAVRVTLPLASSSFLGMYLRSAASRTSCKAAEAVERPVGLPLRWIQRDVPGVHAHLRVQDHR